MTAETILPLDPQHSGERAGEGKGSGHVPAPALGLNVSSGQTPITVNPSAGTATNLSADLLDGKDSTAFAGATNGVADKASEADDADLLDGKDSTAFLPRKVYTKDGAPIPATSRNSPTLAIAFCDSGDVALSGGYAFSDTFSSSDGRHVFSERVNGDRYEVRFYPGEAFDPDKLTPNVTCADFPPLR